jgi:phosphoribosylaminoimidazolecarboxamide formyltransferase/IMP cyclohydrolase
VKTLHPRVHGGLLARRSVPEHMAAAEKHGIGMIDLVVVNLYAFEATVAKDGVTLEDAIENIDIGGPSMLRSAAKNFESVTVVTDPADYDAVLAEMHANGGATLHETRKRLAIEVFRKTSAYDDAIFAYLTGGESLPTDIRFFLTKIQDLRYGENPHQKAAFYRYRDAPEHTLARAEQLHGKELSYNNILDTEAAWTAVREFDDPACVIVKHMNPCGTAIDSDLVAAYDRAFESDPTSAFGGVMAFNRPVPLGVAEHIGENQQFVEVMIAPEFEPAALAMLQEKKNIRLLRTGGLRAVGGRYEGRGVEGGMLVQTVDTVGEDLSDFRVVTKRQPTNEELEQLVFAWKVCKSVKSNAILLAKDFASVGVGAGQMSRVDSARIAVDKAGERAKGAVCSCRSPTHSRSWLRPASRRSSSLAARFATRRSSRRQTSSTSRWSSRGTATSGIRTGRAAQHELNLRSEVAQHRRCILRSCDVSDAARTRFGARTEVGGRSVCASSS